MFHELKRRKFKTGVQFGRPPVNWYENPRLWILILVIFRAWKMTGHGMIMYIAALGGIDTTYYEAARIDGALCAFALLGCSQGNSNAGSTDTARNSTETSGESSSKTGTDSSLSPITLKLWSCSGKYSVQDDILAKFCKKYKDQLNIEKIEYNFVSFGDYEDKMTSLVAGGDDFDGFFVADWMLYPKMANKGAFLPLNDLMQQYALLA